MKISVVQHCCSMYIVVFSTLLIFSGNNNRTSRKKIHDSIKKNETSNVFSENKMGSLAIWSFWQVDQPLSQW